MLLRVGASCRARGVEGACGQGRLGEGLGAAGRQRQYGVGVSRGPRWGGREKEKEKERPVMNGGREKGLQRR